MFIHILIHFFTLYVLHLLLLLLLRIFFIRILIHFFFYIFIIRKGLIQFTFFTSLLLLLLVPSSFLHFYHFMVSQSWLLTNFQDFQIFSFMMFSSSAYNFFLSKVQLKCIIQRGKAVTTHKASKYLEESIHYSFNKNSVWTRLFI